MTPSKRRSTLQLDLKDISARSAGPNIGRLTLVAGSVLVVGIAVASINNSSDDGIPHPVAFSAPADNELSEERKSFKAKEIFVNDTDTVSSSSYVSFQGIPSEAPTETKAQEQNEALTDVVKSDQKTQITNNEIRARKSAFAINQIQVASLAPIPSFNIGNPLVNQFESDPVFAAATPLPLSVTKNEDTDAEPIVLANAAPLSDLDNTPLDSLDVLEADSEENNFDNPEQDTPEKPNTNALSPEENKAEDKWLSATVKKRDTLSEIFNRLGLSSKEAFRLVKMDGAKPLTKIRPGQVFKVTKWVNEEGTEKLKTLRLKTNRFDTLVIEHHKEGDHGYKLSVESREPEVRFTTSSATITGSLLGAAKRAGIPYDTVYELATIFGWQVDFSKDIQKGDHFSVVHEEFFLDNVKVGDGAVIAAQLSTGDKMLQAVRHVAEDGHVNYFAPDGDGIQGSFLRSPIKFARVSSKFSKKRFHPIQKKWKAHKGVDYAAAMKTPIRATGDGVVKFAGSKTGYGRTVILRHGDKYETVYAHMNHFKKGIGKGSRVKQGDIIGYVGRTGWTTGPHLHYEFRVNGKHMNPLTVELPKSAPIEKRYAKTFRQDATKWVTTMTENETISLAQKSP